MRTNESALALMKEFEGLELAAYRCPAGVLTIGYGHTSAAGDPAVTEGMTITEEEADAIFRHDLLRFEAAVMKALKQTPTLNQFGAFVSLCYNIGASAFAKSTAVKRFNAGDINGAAEAITWWNKAGGKVLRGLVRRREAERALVLSDVPAAPEEAILGPVEAEEVKPLAKSKTMWAGGVLAASIPLYEQIRDLLPSVAAEYGHWVLAGIAALVVLNRVAERRAGSH